MRNASSRFWIPIFLTSALLSCSQSQPLPRRHPVPAPAEAVPVRVLRCLPSSSLQSSNDGAEVCLPKESPFRFVEWRKALLNYQRLKAHDELLMSAPVLEVVQPETRAE